MFNLLDHIRKIIQNFINEIELFEPGVGLKKYLSGKSTEDKEACRSSIVFLDFFGLVDIKRLNNDISVLFKSKSATVFAKSLGEYIFEKYKLISNWDDNNAQTDSNFFSHGKKLLYLLEKKRIEEYKSTNYFAFSDLVLVCIKANIDDSLKPKYLFQYNFRTNTMQMVGGFVNKEASYDQSIKEHILNKTLIKENQIKNISLLKGVQSTNLSLLNGYITHYSISIFEIHLEDFDLKLREYEQWLGIEEIEEGRTTEGIEVRSPFLDIKDKQEAKSLFENASLSTQKHQKENASFRILNSENENSVLKKLLSLPESEELEFKSSARWDYVENKLNNGLDKVIVKTINGFMNAKGGNLLIGVDDNASVLGIEKDFESLKKRNTDGYMQFIINLVSDYMGAENCSQISVSFELLNSLTVCIVKVSKSTVPIFVKEKQDSSFYVRTGNNTRLLNSEETYKYIQKHW